MVINIDLTQDSDSDTQNGPQTVSATPNKHNAQLAHRSSVPLKRKQSTLEWPSAFSNSPFSPANFSGFPDPKGAVSDSDSSAQSHQFFQLQAQRHLQSFVQYNQQDHASAGSQVKGSQAASTNGAPQTTEKPKILYEEPEPPKLHSPSAFAHSHKHLQPSTPSPDPAAAGQENQVAIVIPSPSRQLKREIANAHWVESDAPTGLSQEYYPTDAYEKRAQKGAYPKSRRVNRADIPFDIGSPGPFLTSRPELELQLQTSVQRKLAAIKGPAVTLAAMDPKLLAEFENFEFINSNKLRRGVQPAPDEFHGGCSCEMVCDPSRCTCLETEESDSKRTIIPYERAKDDARLMVLTPEFLKRNMMISECGSRCDCSAGCWNRVVQGGRRIRLEIFHTGNRGFGLRSPDRIRAGQFIDCYLGEVVTKEVADTREELCMAKHGHSYLFGLDWFVDVPEEEMFTVDGQKFGALTRFMNHSCNPNCRMFPATRNQADQRLYDLAFFSLKEIPPWTELTFDYNPGSETLDHVDPQAVACLCGESNCRGQLWPNQRKGTR